ncbi:MAG: HEPN domain-containing protein [Candidatus Woesearchaeota archaeon]|nr:HEPN domain-containing protein [Nanoarchaeota archaeon]MBU1622094.1 HEPN domain-containing protein [Nanoarchaeota archaeon]
MVKKNRVPKTEQAMDRAFLNCQTRKKFRDVEKSQFSDYLLRAQKDLSSAERDFKAEDFHWARVKGYQALFYLLNALLVKHLGYFSKDHGCVIVALMKNEIITEETAGKINLLAERTLKHANSRIIYDDIDEFRIQRNFALYKPKAWEDVKKEDVKAELDKIKQNFKILVSLL